VRTSESVARGTSAASSPRVFSVPLRSAPDVVPEGLLLAASCAVDGAVVVEFCRDDEPEPVVVLVVSASRVVGVVVALAETGVSGPSGAETGWASTSRSPNQDSATADTVAVTQIPPYSTTVAAGRIG